MASPAFLSSVPGLRAAELIIDGLALFCFNHQNGNQFWEVAYLRNPRHELGMEIQKVDAQGNPLGTPDQYTFDVNVLSVDVTLTTGSDAHYQMFPRGGPRANNFDRVARDNDPSDLQWMIDIAGPEPGHGNVTQLITGRVKVTLARFHHSLFYTENPSEQLVRLSPKRNSHPSGLGSFWLGPTNERMAGLLLAAPNSSGEIRFDGLGIDPLPYNANQRYKIEIINMDTQSATHIRGYAKGDFHLFYDVVDVNGDKKELWAVPRNVGKFAPDGDCNPSEFGGSTLEPLIQ
jgi:hypothetical protein